MQAIVSQIILTPVLLTSEYATGDLSSVVDWGEVNGRNSGQYIDQFVMLILGGVPMQVC